MGCDIHLYVENRTGGKWVSVDLWSNQYSEATPSVAYDDMLYHERNYSLFSILANVRNGYGFAGVPTGQGFVPIAAPRGLPQDVSAEVAAVSESWGADGHSHSYLTVREILDFDWNQKTTLCGWVNPNQFRQWKVNGRPASWSGDVWGANVKKVSLKEMEAAIATSETLKDERILEGVITHVEWTVYYHEKLGSFAPALIRACHKLNPEDVRFVFFFDN
jgi:hypothetical protein